MARSFARWVCLALLLVWDAGCERETRCYPGDYQACECAGGADGYAQCNDAGSDYGACDCTSGVPGATDAGGGGAGGGGGLLPFMATCGANEDCASGLCHTYNAKGPKCTLPCQTDNQCPAPSPGCNNMGVCKAP